MLPALPALPHRRSSLSSPTSWLLLLTSGPSLDLLLTASHCQPCLVCFSPRLHLCVAFWFHLLGFFSFSKTPSRHSHTRTDPTSPRSATETETIQERCVSLPTAALHLCPLTSALFSLSSHFQLLLICVCADGIMKYHFLFLVKSSCCF